MMYQDFLKKLGILGVAVGLTASPLAFAQFDEPAQDPGVPIEEADPNHPEARDPINDPTAPTDPAAPADPTAPADPMPPADEPGFGTGTEPLPDGEGDPSSEQWETPDDADQGDTW